MLAEWAATLDQLSREYELLVVVDSMGGAPNDEAVKRFPAVKLLCQPKQAGPGAALRTGLAAARHRLLLYAPCDRQYSPTDVRLLLAEIDKVHLASGYRKWQSVPLPLRVLGAVWRCLLRVLLSIPQQAVPGWLGWRGHGHALLLRAFFGVRLQDPGCTLRLFRRCLFGRIPIQSDGDFAHDEILAKANFLGGLMTAVPVSYRPADQSASANVREMVQEARRVFSHPDFGPAVLPAGTVWPGPDCLATPEA